MMGIKHIYIEIPYGEMKILFMCIGAIVLSIFVTILCFIYPPIILCVVMSWVFTVYCCMMFWMHNSHHIL